MLIGMDLVPGTPNLFEEQGKALLLFLEGLFESESCIILIELWLLTS